MDETLKHRLIGVAVLIALVAIFLPILIKDSNKTIDRVAQTSFQIPAQPKRPKAVKENYQSRSVAQVNIDQVRSQTAKLADERGQRAQVRYKKMQEQQAGAARQRRIARAKAAAVQAQAHKRKVAYKQKLVRHVKAKPKPHRTVVARKAKPAPVKRKTAAKSKRVVMNNRWVVQLASFTTRNSAVSLAKRLRKQGFPAYTRRGKNSRGTRLYRVFVGPGIKRVNAESLVVTLKRAIRIKGIVVRYQPTV